MEGLECIIREHPFFARLQDAFLSLVYACANNVRFESTPVSVPRGRTGDWFYLLRHRRVALQVTARDAALSPFRPCQR
jgi:CRP/FNR family transcriptional regulator, cyclic AMP receptor protein